MLASLDGIAMRAGVGNATLYRNFRTRDDLLVAVMEASIEALLDNGSNLSRSRGPRSTCEVAFTIDLATTHLA